MNVAKSHSHLNGEEWLKVHQPEDYDELLEVIADIDAEKCRTKRSREKRMKGKLLYSPTDLNSEFAVRLNRLGWESHRYNYYVAHSHEQAEVMAEQREYLEQRGYDTIYSYNQTDHVKDEIAVEVQFGKYAFVAYDLFVKHLVFYTGRAISVGV